MDIETTLRCIGYSHLLQPPLTLLLAQRLRLRPAFEGLPPVAFRVAQNMAVAAVALPTSLGLFIALHARDVAELGPTWGLALGVALFWTWRLERQLRVLGPLLAVQSRIFCVSELIKPEPPGFISNSVLIPISGCLL